MADHSFTIAALCSTVSIAGMFAQKIPCSSKLGTVILVTSLNEVSYVASIITPLQLVTFTDSSQDLIFSRV